MNLADLKLKLEEMGVDQSKIDEDALSVWLREWQDNKPNFSEDELKVKIFELETQRDNEQDWRKKAQLQARIISAKLNY